MPTFNYVARNKQGTKQNGSLTAESRNAAQQQLRQRGLQADKLVEAGAKTNIKLNKRDSLGFGT